jgi:hypothetical protein
MADPLETDLLFAYRNSGVDASGNGQDLAPTAGVTTAAGLGGAEGAACRYPAADSLSRDAPILSGSEWGLSIWMRKTGAGFTGFFEQTGGAFPSHDLVVALQDDGFHVTISIGPSLLVVSGPVSDAGAWNHLVVSGDVDAVRLYVNKVLVDVGPAPVSISTFAGDHAGFQSDGATVDFEYFLGWSRSLSGATNQGDTAADGSDVDRLFAGGSGFDPTAPPADVVGARTVTLPPERTDAVLPPRSTRTTLIEPEQVMDSIKLEMAPGEKRPFSFDFRRRAELRDDPLDANSLGITIDPGTGLTAGAPTLSGTAIKTALTASTTLGTYRLKITGTTQANHYVEIGYVDVTIAVPPS